jgi:hypothetical protein
MIRYFSKEYGDNAPSQARLTLSVSGSGQMHIDVGYRPSAASVAFARLFDERSDEILSYDVEDEHDDPVVFVGYYNLYTDSYEEPYTDTGFWVQYRNIPETPGFDVNYYCDH